MLKCDSLFLWSRRDSNPGPNICPMSLLRVYFVIIFRQKSRKQTNQLLAYLLKFRFGVVAPPWLSQFLVDLDGGYSYGLLC